MIKLFRYLKHYIGMVIVIIVMLFLQAYCELSLPTYTSNIVNIGIQQSGIEETVPKYISKESADGLMLFMTDEDKSSFRDAYTFLEDGEWGKNYYQMNEISDEEYSSLKDMIKKPLMVNMLLSSEDMEDQIQTMLKLPEGTDIMTAMGMMDEATRMAISDGIFDKVNDLGDSLTDQMIVASIVSEYETVGVDTAKIRNDYILKAGLKMTLLATAAMLMAIIVVYCSSKVAAGFSMDIREDVYKKVISFSNTEFDKFSTASLITRSTNDIQQVQLIMMMLFRIVLYAPILGIGGIVKVLNTNSSMTWIIGLAVGVILIVIATLFIFVMPKFKKLQSMIDRVNLVMREILTGLSVIRAFSTHEHEEERFDEANKNLMKTNLFVNYAMSFMMPIMMMIMNGVTLLIVYMGAKGIENMEMQVGDMMAFIQYAMQIIMSFLMISMVSIMLPRAAVAGDRISEVLGTKATIKNPKDSLIDSMNNSGELVFDHVDFKYADAPECVLSDINFVAKKGETTAVIGSTGSGKSTLVNLIPRFFDVSSGSIIYNGVDIRKIKQEELRSKIGYVPQKSVLFSGTIKSNIGFGLTDAKDEEIIKAATIAQATEFINEKSDKYDSQVSQGGSNVSGGQKQRLSIARAIAKNPEIYIFDDSFSALDFKTDITLRKALADETKESIVLIVAQRISTIMHANQIIVLDEGKVAGIGTHKELLETCEVYEQIASSQLSKEELEASIKEVSHNE